LSGTAAGFNINIAQAKVITYKKRNSLVLGLVRHRDQSLRMREDSRTDDSRKEAKQLVWSKTRRTITRISRDCCVTGRGGVLVCAKEVSGSYFIRGTDSLDLPFS